MESDASITKSSLFAWTRTKTKLKRQKLRLVVLLKSIIFTGLLMFQVVTVPVRMLIADCLRMYYGEEYEISNSTKCVPKLLV